MENRTPQIRYTELFERDLISVTEYIANVLCNPEAAERLVDDVEKAIVERSVCALSFAPFPSRKARKHPYYRIYVRNYTVFYVVVDNVMEVRRFLYSARDVDSAL